MTDSLPLAGLLRAIVDNRGRSCPTAQSGIPLIATNCVRDDALYPSYEKARYVSRHTYETWFRAHPQPGDILFVNKATPGRVALVPDPVDFCIAQDMVALRADESKVYPKYLFAALRSRVIKDQIERMHVGSLIPHFKKSDFDKLLIPLPARDEQVRVGDMYFDYSARIEVNRLMNETLEDIARALFDSWFVDFDPVRAKSEGSDPGLPAHLAELFPDRLADSALGPIPEGWQAGTLADLVQLNPESWTARTLPETVDYVDLTNTKWGRIAGVSTYARDDAPSRARRKLRRGDTVVGTVRPGNGAYALINRDHLTGSTAFAVLRPRNPRHATWCYLAATRDPVIRELEHRADGGVYPAVRPEVVVGIGVAVPPRAVLDVYAGAASPALERAARNEIESAALEALREALLPGLVSGESGLRARTKPEGR